MIQITAPLSHGSSGGPVLNSAGDVIGIAVGTLSAGQNLKFAIPVSDLISLSARTESRVADYTNASKVNDRKAQENYELGWSLEHNSQNAEAVEAFKRAIRLRRDYPEAYVGLGWAYNSQENYGDAMAAFEKAIQLKSDYSDAYEGMGKSHEGLLRPAEAIEAYKQAIRVKA